MKGQVQIYSFALMAATLVLASWQPVDAAGGWLQSAADKLKWFKRQAPEGRSVARAAESNQSDDQDDNEDEAEDSSFDSGSLFKPKCFLSRQADTSFHVDILFFSYKNHEASNEPVEPVRLVMRHGYTDQQVSEEIKSKLLGPEKPFNPELTSYFITHGFLADWQQDSWQTKLKDYILNETLANVFIVDWSGGAKPMLFIDYGAAVANTRVAGEYVARFIKNLIQESGATDADHYHLIGHSLGGHISGFVGYNLQENGYTVGAITALDPAGPCFTTPTSANDPQVALDGYLDPESRPDRRRRLSAAAGKLVIAIHTDSSLFGMAENCAHFDVYANGGTRQPGCLALDPMTRIHNLMRGRVESDLSMFEMACEHGYGYMLVTAFAGHIMSTLHLDGNHLKDSSEAAQGTKLASVKQQEPVEEVADEKCYPMAFECSNWNQFKSGECGFCLDDDPNCIYIGLTKAKEARPNLEKMLNYSQVMRQDQCPFHLPDKFTPHERSRQFNNDLLFNDEEDQLTNLRGWKPKTKLDDSKYLVSSARHFIKTAKDWPHCMFQYQIVIGVKASQQVRNSRFFLKLPLDGDQPKGRQRLVQVSHLLHKKSRAQYNLDHKLFNYLGQAYPRKSLRELKESDSEMSYYTALVSFEANSNCSDIDPSDERTLCKPIASFEGAELLAESGETLSGVRWVAINYMSGLKVAGRLVGSGLLQAKLGESSRRVKSTRLRPKLKPVKMSDHIASNLAFNRDTWRNGVASSSLKYYAELKPVQKKPFLSSLQFLS